jgi:transposase
MVLADGAGTPLGVPLEKAAPSEVTLVEATLANVKVQTGKRDRGQPKRLIGDSAYDSNTVRALLVKRGREPIIPARSHNTVATHHDGRKMRRDKRRGIIERSNSWLQTCRRLVVRYERSEQIYAALVHMACALITLKRVLG